MQLEVIGVGGAGCRIADAIRATESAQRSFLADVFAFDTDERDLQGTVVPESHRHRFGGVTDADPEGGLEGDLDRGFELGQTVTNDLLAVLEEERTGEPDATLVVVGLGGATGGGGAPALVTALQREHDRPVYVLATLPADREFDTGTDADGSGPHAGTAARVDPGEPPRPTAATNAIRTLERLDGLANAIVCFDNESWLRSGETVADGRDRCNRELATRIEAVFAGGEAESDETIAQNVVDADDVSRIVGDESAIVALGYGDQEVDTDGSRFGLGLLSAEPDVDRTESVSAIETVTRKGSRGKLTLECGPDAAERALVIVGGPTAWLDRQAIADARRDLQSAVGGTGVLGAVAPRPDGDRVFAAVVYAGVEAERLAALRAAADRNYR